MDGGWAKCIVATAASTMTHMTLTQDWDAWAAVWTVLGRLFGQAPNDESLDQVRSEEMLASWPLPEGQRTSEGLDLLRTSREQNETAEQVREDHWLLVRGPGKARAVPWESVYLSNEGLVFEEQTLQVREFYRRFGLQAPNLNREPDDHISLELEFMATLMIRALDAAEADGDPEPFIEAHTDFATQHLLKWAPEFFNRVEQNADTSFYRGWGVLGQDACAQLQAALAASDQND